MENAIREFVNKWADSQMNWYKTMNDRFNEMKQGDEYPKLNKPFDTEIVKKSKEMAELDRAFWKKHGISWQVADEIKQAGHEYGRQELQKKVKKQAEKRIREFIAKIEEMAGKVESFKIYIHAGEINGWVKGEKTTVTVNTISAGGHNIQRFHYRTLVKDAKTNHKPA